MGVIDDRFKGYGIEVHRNSHRFGQNILAQDTRPYSSNDDVSHKDAEFGRHCRANSTTT